jgi:hypothetical protein
MICLSFYSIVDAIIQTQGLTGEKTKSFFNDVKTLFLEDNFSTPKIGVF